MTPELKGAYVDQEGILHMETKSIIPETLVEITAKVNGQIVLIGETSIHVFDCLKDFKLEGIESSYNVQVGTVIPMIQLKGAFGEDKDNHCRINKYEIEGKTD